MDPNSLPDFPAELLVVEAALIMLENDTTKIEIKLAPFEMEENQVDTSIDFNLGLEAHTLFDLADKSFSFPSNPDDGYVEGSIYIWSVHNPIDLHSITFGVVSDNMIEAKVKMTFVFEFEGYTKNLTKSLALNLISGR